MNSIQFSLPYPGASASTNHGYALGLRNGKPRMFMTQEAKAFKDEVTTMAKQAISEARWFPVPGTVLHVTITGYFPNKRHSDVGNLTKFLIDGIEDALNCYVEGAVKHNDRDWGYTVEPPVYRPGKAMLEVTVYEHKREPDRIWQKCPICNGIGSVSGGFSGHAGDNNFWKSTNTIEICQRCNGRGIIVTPSKEETRNETLQ